MAIRARVTKEGLLIPREVAERLGSEEVEILEEPGRLLVSPVGAPSGRTQKQPDEEDPILSMGEDPVDDEITDASVNHDRYLYTGD